MEKNKMDNLEKTIKEATEGKGKVVIIPKEKAIKPDFFKALMDFQYGDEETSDAAFEKIKKADD